MYKKKFGNSTSYMQWKKLKLITLVTAFITNGKENITQLATSDKMVIALLFTVKYKNFTNLY